MGSNTNKIPPIEKILTVCKEIYYRDPKFFGIVLWPILAIRRLYKTLRLETWIITGKEISSGQKFGIVFAGHKEDKNYFVKLAFNSDIQDNYLGKKWLWSIIKTARTKPYGSSLLIMDVPRYFHIISKRMKCLYVPSWISGEIDSSMLESLFKNRNTSLKSDISKIKRNKLHFEITDELPHLRNFYDNMYIPYISKSHTDSAILMDYREVLREFKKRRLFNTLLLIKKNGEHLAGILLGYKKNTLKLSTLGVKDGNQDYIKDGVIGALFYFSVNYAIEKGFTKINFGNSRPFFEDGALRYKKKWGQKISYPKKSGFFFKMLSENDGIIGFFINNPLIYKDRTGLNGAIFVKKNQQLSQNDLINIYKQYYINGLSKLFIYHFEQSDHTKYQSIPSKFSDKITICPTTNIFDEIHNTNSD